MLVTSRKKSYIIDASTAFILAPGLRGLWIRTHPSVLLARCSHCGAKKGEPCQHARARSSNVQFTSQTHSSRRADAGAMVRGGKRTGKGRRR